MRRTIAWWAIVCLLTAACATARRAPEADERALAARADAEEQALREKTSAYDDTALATYLGAVADRVAPGFTVIVLRDPTLNAFALPNRHVIVHTGLLSRLESESQLAMIVAREAAHVTQRHVRAADADARVPYTAADAPAAKAILGSRLALMTTAAITGYGRDLERDADRGAIERLVRAGYDPRQAAAVFPRLRADLPERGPLEVFRFGDDAWLAERIETTEPLASGAAPPSAPPVATAAPPADTGDFARRMRVLVRENAYEDVRAGRFAVAQRQLDRVLALTPDDAVAHTYYGDLYRLRAQRAADAATRDADARRALASYERAVELDPTAAEPHRQLGFLYYQQGDTTRAKAAFERYLALQPDGVDARRVREYLVELTRSR